MCPSSNLVGLERTRRRPSGAESGSAADVVDVESVVGVGYAGRIECVEGAAGVEVEVEVAHAEDGAMVNVENVEVIAGPAC
jgi:hypothetical protein